MAKRAWYAFLPNACSLAIIVLMAANYFSTFGDLDYTWQVRTGEIIVRTTADGRKLLVVHGDQFDGAIACAKWLAHLGDSAYTFALQLNVIWSAVRRRLGLPYWSLSAFLKQKVKNETVDRELSITATTEFEITINGEKQSLSGKEGLALLEGKEGASVTVKCDKDVNVLKVTAMIKK